MRTKDLLVHVSLTERADLQKWAQRLGAGWLYIERVGPTLIEGEFWREDGIGRGKDYTPFTYHRWQKLCFVPDDGWRNDKLNYRLDGKNFVSVKGGDCL